MALSVQNDANFVFAKMKGYPQWPGVIISPDLVPEEILAHRKGEAQKLVRFFRHDNKPGEVQWFSDSDLVGFQTTYQDMLEVAKGKTGNTYVHLRQSIKNAERYFQARELISEDGSPVPPAPSVSPPQPEEDVAGAETASAEDAASDTSSEIKIPPLPTATKRPFLPLTPTPSIGAPSPRMLTRRALAIETEKEKMAATPDKELTPGPTSSQRKRPNGEPTPEFGKKKIPPAPSARPGTQSPSPSRPAPSSQTKASNGTSSTKTPQSRQSSDKANSQLTQAKLPNDGQSTVLGGTQSSTTVQSQSTNVTNVKSPAKSSAVAMDVTTADASREPASEADEDSEQPKVASPSETEPENENVSELVRHLKYLGESTAPTCENIRAIAEKYRKEEGELKQLLTDGFFHARQRDKQNVVFSVETIFELPNEAVIADGRKVAFVMKSSTSSESLKLLTGPRDIAVPGWFDVGTKLASEFTRPEPTRDLALQGKFALHWNMEVDHKFNFTSSWLSQSDQETLTYSIKSIRVHFDVPDVKAVGRYEVTDATKEIPGRNIKVTLGGVTYLKSNHPLSAFRKAVLLVEYQLHWRNFLSLQIRTVHPTLFLSGGLSKVEQEMVEDRIFHMKHAESRRKYGGVTIVSEDQTAYGADAYVILDKLNLNPSLKRVDIKHPSWVLEAFLVTVYDGLWLKMGHLEDLMEVMSFATEYQFKDLQTVSEMVVLECLARSAAFPPKVFSDVVLQSKMIQQFLTAAFEETTSATVGSTQEWLQLLSKKPELIQMRLETLSDSRKTLSTEWTLKVKAGPNTEVKLRIDSRETVGTLKAKIESFVGIDRKKMSLRCNSVNVRNVLKDEENLLEVGFVDGDLVYAVARSI